jgi:hypothetical protein
MNNININDDIITKYLCGEASPEEAISIEEWLTTSPQNRAYFDNMEQTFLLVSKREKAIPDHQKAWDKIHKNISPPVKSFKWVYGVAADFFSRYGGSDIFDKSERKPRFRNLCFR